MMDMEAKYQEALEKMNAEQKAAFIGFLDFMQSDEKAMSIEGPGGTGKSYLLGLIVDIALPYFQYLMDKQGKKTNIHDIIMTATTNPAATALSDYTKKPVPTIQSTLGLVVKPDFKTGVSSLVVGRGRERQIITNSLVIIDEASIIDEPLRNFILNRTMNCKIIFVGDPFQLPPVGYSSSPVYNMNLRKYELSQPMRNAGNKALIDICLQTRETVRTGIFKPLILSPGSIDLLHGEDLQKEVDSIFASEGAPARIMAYTNSKVHDYNTYLRELRNEAEGYYEGEILVANSLLMMDGSKISIEEEVTLSDVQEPEMLTLPDEVTMEVVRATVTSKFARIESVPIPTDMQHFRDVKKYFAKKKNWEVFYMLEGSFFDARLRDCSTVHKAQGSSMDVSILDLGDISKCNIPNQVARLIYVGVSRARKRLILTGSLASKYGGILNVRNGDS